MKKNIQNEILKKIEKGEVRMKPKWQFEAKEKGKSGVALGTLILAAVGIASVIFFIKEYEPWTLWELGEVGKQIVIEDFPYWWFVVGIILVATFTNVIKRVGDNYKRTEKEIWIITIVVTMIITAVVWNIRKLF